MGNEFKNYSWKNIMNMLFSQINPDYDRTEGSLFYDIFSPVANVFMVIVEQLKAVYNNTFIGTAQGEYLDARVAEAGLKRIEATYAVKKVYVYDKSGNLFDINIGDLVSTKSDSTITYSLTKKLDVGTYEATCMIKGTIGNEYVGEMDLLSNNTSVGSVIMADLIVSARNEETDEELRRRHLESTGAKTFGGNIADYRRLVGTELTEISQMQVYPRIASDSNIILSVVDNDNNPLTDEQCLAIQEKLNPSTYDGMGAGIVPIGHHPVVVSPNEVTTNFTLQITPATGRTVEELETEITEVIEEYIDELRESFANLTPTFDYTLTCFKSQVIAKVLSVEGVLDVVSVLINGENDDLEYTETRVLQEIPKMGTIVLS